MSIVTKKIRTCRSSIKKNLNNNLNGQQKKSPSKSFNKKNNLRILPFL